MSPDVQPRGVLSKMREYLLGDFEYVPRFGANLDYEDYWAARSQQDSEMERAMYAHKFRLISGLVEPGSSVLDIGCGDGSLLAYLREVRSIQPHGIELSQKACEMARQKGVDVVQADVTADDWTVPEPVDYIVMSEVLEHLPSPESLLLQLKGLCRRRLLVDVPNTGARNDRLRLLLGRTPKQWVFHPEEHLRFWTVSDFLVMCRQLGIKVERYYGLYDPYYDFGLPWWRIYPGLLSRYILYVLAPAQENGA
jgi:methionine biosynthesis protein MetW